MRKMELTSGQVKGFRLSEDGNVGFLTVLATTYKGKNKHNIWISAILKNNLLAAYQENPIEGGINLGGTFDVTSFRDSSKQLHPKVYIAVDWYEPAKAYGTGLLRVSFSEVHLTEDLREYEASAHAKMVYNYPNSPDRAMWCDLTFWNDMVRRAKTMKLKKGSTVDLDAEFDVEISTKDDKQYLNIGLIVSQIKYSALPVKPKTPEQPAPTYTQPTQPAPSYENTTQAQDNTVEESSLDAPGEPGEPGENEYF